MKASIPGADPPEQDRAGPSAVLPPAPSSRLLSQCIQVGRPVYRPAPGVAVPRLEQVPDSLAGHVVPEELHSYRRAPESVLRVRVAMWLEQPEAQRSRSGDLDTRDLTQLRFLTAAALRDVAGLSEASVREWLGPPTIDADRRRAILAGIESDLHQGDTRATRRQISQGRDLWRRLGAWPWWALVDAGMDLSEGMPRDWHKLPRVVETYRVWRRLSPDGKLV